MATFRYHMNVNGKMVERKRYCIGVTYKVEYGYVTRFIASADTCRDAYAIENIVWECYERKPYGNPYDEFEQTVILDTETNTYDVTTK